MRKIVLLLIVGILTIMLSACGSNDIFYTVSFDSQGGSLVEKQEVKKNDLIMEPDEPIRDGYDFMGWFNLIDESSKKKWDFDLDRVNSNLTLYAGWIVNNEEEEINKMFITIFGNKLEVSLENNQSVKALVEILKQGDITYKASEYGGFEMVGNIGLTLPSNDVRVTTEPGDVVLYQSNQICLFVDSNTWAYTRIGKIKGYTAQELRSLLGIGKGEVEITISL